MLTAWRIVKKKHEKSAFSGEGARLFGGRWNSAGHAVVYAAETLSGAILEILIHSNRQLLSHYRVFRLEFPKKIVSFVSIDALPRHWRETPPPPELAHIGDHWYSNQRKAVLCVPNAIVPMETHYLINPMHKDFDRMTIEGPIDYTIDERLI